MAEQQDTLKQPIQPNTTEGIPTTEDTAQVPLPATPENQQATQEAQEDAAASQAAIAQARNSLLNQTRHGIATSEIDEVDAALEAKRLRQSREEQESINKKVAASELKQQQALISEKLRRANEAQAFLTEIGQPSQEIQAQIEQLNAELQGSSIVEDKVDNQAPATPSLEDPEENLARIQAEDSMDLYDKTQVVKNQTLDKIAQIQGEVEAVELQRQKLLEEQQKIFNDAEDLKRQAAETQVDNIWSGTNTGNKIMAALAIGLGAYRAELRGGGPNQGLQMVNDIIDRQVKQRQDSFKNQLALKSALIDKTRNQLQVLNAQTSSKQKKAQLVAMEEQLKAQQAQTQQALVAQSRQDQLAAKLASQEGLSREELFELDMQLPKQQLVGRAIPMKGGRVFIASASPGQVKKFKEEELPSMLGAIEGLNQLKEINERNPIGARIPFTEDKAAANVIRQSLVGNLRLSLFGPGVMTDSERAIAEKIIASPGDLSSIPGLTTKKLDTLIKKLKTDIKTRAESQGIQLPPSENEKNLDAFMQQKMPNIWKKRKSNPKEFRKARQKAATTMIDLGYWKEDDFPFGA